MSRLIAVNDKGMRIGEDHQRARYTDRDIELVFMLKSEDKSVREIAGFIGMSKSQVWNILSGRHRCQLVDRYIRV